MLMTTSPRTFDEIAAPLAGKVALVTGGSRSIGAAIAKKLAADGAKVALTYNASPAKADVVVQSIEQAGGTALAIDADAGNADAVRAAGGTPYYHSVDLRDAGAVERAVADVRERSGRVDVLLHAAGLEISRRLPDKEPGEFDLVFDVKSDGWFNLLHAVGEMPLGATVAFSSIAGRFGNAGQTDYSSANDLLCKTASGFRTTRPATRGIAIDWTAWGEIGMAAPSATIGAMDCCTVTSVTSTSRTSVLAHITPALA